MKGIFSHHKLVPVTVRKQGYKEISPFFWIQKDSFSRWHEYIEGKDGRTYCVFVRGDSNKDLIDTIKAYFAGKITSISSLKGRWLIVLYEEFSSHKNQPRIILISDRLGSHRVYYSYDDSSFVWSTNFTEIIELKRQCDQGPSFDVSALNGYLHFLHQPASKTIVQGIFSLPPSSYLILSEGNLRITKYWSPEFSPPIESEKKAVSEIKHMIDDIISPQILGSDKSTGLFLSGGIDSSLLCGICAKVGLSPITFTVGFDEAKDEREAARAIADHFKTDHREIIIRPEDVPELLWDVTRCLGFPTGNPSSLATYIVARQAGGEVSKLISGLGSDEIFGGHTKHILARYWPIAQKAVSFTRENFSPFGATKSRGIVGRPNQISNYMDLYTFFDQHQLNRLLLPEYISTKNNFYSDLQRDSFQEEQFLTDIFTWLSDDLLPIATTLIAQYDIWLDLPLCSDDILICGARIPLKMKVKGRQRKWVLQKAVNSLVPNWVLKKKPQGFTLPMGRWLRGPLKILLDTYLDSDVLEKRGIFKPDMIQRLIIAHLKGKADLSLQLWGLITLEVWQRIFLDPENTPIVSKVDLL